MVKKMKLKFLLILFFTAIAANAMADDVGIRQIAARGKVLCGSDLEFENYAYKDKNGKWHGMDADLCKAFSFAIFGKEDNFDLVSMNPLSAKQDLKDGKIDIILSGMPYSASLESEGNIVSAGVLYYQRQMFLAKKIEGATSMEAYKNSKVCVANNSEELANLEDYNQRYALGLNFLFFPDLQKSKEAFFLKRCDLITGNEILLKGIVDKGILKDRIEVLPEVINVNPIHALAAKNNPTLQVAAKWILNALVLAEKEGITSSNVDIFMFDESPSTKNLLGLNKKLWMKFNLQPDWVVKYVKTNGNFGEIFDKNLGEASKFKSPRDKGNLIKNGGLVAPESFL